jgi:hypothetical protein
MLKVRHWVRWRVRKALDERATSLEDAIAKMCIWWQIWGVQLEFQREMSKVGVAEGWKTSLARASLISNAKMNPCDRFAESITPTHRLPLKSTLCIASHPMSLGNLRLRHQTNASGRR